MMPRLLPGHTPALPPMRISPVLVHTLDRDLLKDNDSTLPMFEFPAPNSTWHGVSISQMFIVQSKNEWEDSKWLIMLPRSKLRTAKRSKLKDSLCDLVNFERCHKRKYQCYISPTQSVVLGLASPESWSWELFGNVNSQCPSCGCWFRIYGLRSLCSNNLSMRVLCTLKLEKHQIKYITFISEIVC